MKKSLGKFALLCMRVLPVKHLFGHESDILSIV